MIHLQGRTRRPSWLAAWLVLSAIGTSSIQAQDAPPQPVKVQRRDSAGIAIFESTVTTSTPLRAPFVVDTAPAFRIGVVTGRADSAAMIVRFAGSRVLRSGNIAVADDYDGRLRFYSRYGAFISEAGGRSDSSALSAIRAVEPKGDTLVVATATGVSLYNAAGKHLSTSPAFRGNLLTVMQSGRYLVRRSTSETDAFQGQKGVVKSLIMDTLFFVDNRGVFSGRVATLPGRIHVSLFNPDPNPLGFTITFLESPFEPESYYSATRTGFFYTDGRSFEARHYLPTGRPNRILRLAQATPAITPAMAESWRQTILRKYPVLETRRYIEWVLGQYAVPAKIPVVRAMKVASNGSVWLREHAFPAEAAAKWHVFNGEGAYEGYVTLPSTWNVQQIENEFMLVSSPGQFGNQVVSMHSITRSGSE